MRVSGREGLIVLCFFSFLAFAFFSPALLRGLVLAPGDGTVVNYPLRVGFFSALREGTLPLWNPYIFGGFPFLGDIQTGALYPLNLLFLLLAPPTAMNTIVIASYALAGFFVYLYGREIGCHRAGATLSGLTFAFGGFMVAQLGHTQTINAAPWLPCFLFCIERLRRRRGEWWVCGAAGAAAIIFFAGHPQIYMYAMVMAGFYVLFCGLMDMRSQRPPRTFLGGVAALIGGGLLAAVQLFPTWELARHSVREGIPYEFFISYSFPPIQLPMLLFPYLFGAGAPNPLYSLGYFGSWNPTELTGYVGLLPLMLAATNISRVRYNHLVVFWLSMAVLSLVLAFGGNTPLYRLLFHLPGYSSFRVPARHLMNFSLAIAVLAGLGFTSLTALDRGQLWRRCLWVGGMVAGGMLIASFTAPLWGKFLASQLNPGLDPQFPRIDFSLSNPAIFVPMIFAIMGVGTLWIFALYPSRTTKLLLLAITLLDLCSFGQFVEWSCCSPRVEEMLEDSQTVAFIKHRSSQLSAYRVFSFTPERREANSVSLSGAFLNTSMLRGLQNLGGCDPLMLSRYGKILGKLEPCGEGALDPDLILQHSGVDLLNCKYLLIPSTITTEARDREIAGVGFRLDRLNLSLNAEGQRAVLRNPQPVTATALGIISALGNAALLPEGERVARITVWGTDGAVIERDLRAGQDTAEWAWDRQDVRPLVRHRRAQIAESRTVTDSDGRPFPAHKYFTILDLGGEVAVERVEVEQTAPSSVALSLDAVSLHHAKAGTSIPLTRLGCALANSERWRALTSLEGIDIYENLGVLPRAWLVPRVVVLPSPEAALQAIEWGQLPGGEPFDPHQVAFIEAGEGMMVDPFDPEGRVDLTDYTTNRIELLSHSTSPAFLVLSEIYYPGWKAFVDGQEVPIERANYVLRGVRLVAGSHRIQLLYDPLSVKLGAAISLGTFVLLAGVAGLGHRRR